MKDPSLKGKRYALIIPSDDDDDKSHSRSSSKHYNNTYNTNALLKPTIKIGNYFFAWNEDTPGIYSNEIDSFKNFVKKMIPYLEECMNIFNVDNDKDNDKSDDNNRSSGNGGVERRGIKFKKMLIDKGRICISEKYNDKISFVLNVDNIGTSIFSREEHVLFVENIKTAYDLRLVESQHKWESDDDQKSVILKWTLGELLFDRIKSR